MGQELHGDDLAVEQKASIVFLQEAVQLFAKRLGVMRHL